MRLFAASILLVACGRAAVPTPEGDANAPPPSVVVVADASIASGSDASDASDSSDASLTDADADTCTYDPKDTPEPTAPRIECTFRREVRCVPSFPVTAAYQRWFPFCPRSIAPWAKSSLRKDAEFSAEETCKRRNEREREGCCYVQFVTEKCR